MAAASILARAAREEWIDKEDQRMKANLRSLSKDEARRFPNAEEIAKVQYL